MFAFVDGNRKVTVTAHYRENGFLLEVPNGKLFVSGEDEGDNRIVADLDGARVNASVVREPQGLTVFVSKMKSRAGCWFHPCQAVSLRYWSKWGRKCRKGRR